LARFRRRDALVDGSTHTPPEAAMTERDIFLAVIDLPTQSARAAYLDTACGPDTALRGRVEALLRSHDDAGSFLGTPLVTPPDPSRAATLLFAAPPDPNPTDGEPLTFLAASSRPDSLGRIGHYEVLQVLGRGAFGIVFRAFDEVLQRVVAVKVLSPQVAATSPARKRFLREARSSAQVRHENVVQVYAVEEQPLPYLVMEFVPGETLQQHLDRTGPLDVSEILRIGRQIAEGLAAAHATDLIHRDIKPGNILIEGGQLRVKITDFGLARAADDASLTQSGIIAGTPMYMAPEQALCEPIDQRADLFSLGSVLYQMTTGRPPFRANSTMAVLKRVAEDDPRAIREIIPESPPWLCDVIAKLHAKNPDDRFRSAREVADLLAVCEARLKANPRLSGFTRVPPAGPGRTGRRKRVAAALGILLAALGVYTVSRPAPTAPQDPPKSARAPAGWGGWPTDAPAPAVAPFGAARARAHQEAWANYLGVPVEYTNSVGMSFVLIPPGEFLMGATPAEVDADLGMVAPHDAPLRACMRSQAPRHRVVLTQPFYLGAREVTQAEYKAVTGTNPSYFAATGGGRAAVAGIDTANHPVERVSWDDAVGFCARLDEQEGAASTAGAGYRLPAEAEWEFACRAGTTTRFWSGDADADMQRAGWVGANAGGRPHPAGQKPANPFGLHDTHGNVWEWVQDRWEQNYYARFLDAPAVYPGSAPPEGTPRVFRGGFWDGNVALSSAAARIGHDQWFRNEHVGFRAVLAVDAVKKPGKVRPPTRRETAPFTDAVGEQVEAVRAELKRRNPDFDGTLTPTVEGDAVTGLEFFSDGVTDVSPVRALPRLTTLNCRGRAPGALSDLTPLKGMRLTTLHVSNTAVSDLSPLKGMPLTHIFFDNTPVADLSPLDGMSLKVLNCSYTKVSSLAPLKGMSLIVLWCNHSAVDDLSPLKGMPLEWVTIHATNVTDLTPLKGLPLVRIYLDYDAKRDREVLRSLTTLQNINDKPADEFWKDAGRD
jgi:serine/threonine protein kinase/formylglycine-generating enzyme required for sulfatase activity